MDGVSVKAECLILSPVTLQVNVTRNLSSSWYNDHPDIEISGKLCNFSVSGVIRLEVTVMGFTQNCHYVALQLQLQKNSNKKFKITLTMLIL